MPTYTYACEACGVEQEHHTPISAHTATVPCGCGSLAAQVYNWQGETIVKGQQYAFKKDAACLPVGWEHGNLDPDRQEQRYAKLIRETKKRARQVDKQACKGGIRHIASIPRELVRMRSNQFGKDYFDPSEQSTKELKDKLKRDDLLFKD